MYVQVRTIDGKKTVTLTISKLTTVEQFKSLVENELEAPVDRQRLFYRGKQLEDGYTLFNYDVKINDVIQLMIKLETKFENNDDKQPVNKLENDDISSEESVESVDRSVSVKQVEGPPCESLYYKIGDFVDAKDFCYGAWFESKIIGISKNTQLSEADISEQDDGLEYKLTFTRDDFTDAPLLVKLNDIRPIARKTIPPEEVAVGDVVMVNYNIENPCERGFWYDMEITFVNLNGRRKPDIQGTLVVGTENTTLENCVLKFIDEIYSVEKSKLLSEKSEKELRLMQTDPAWKRKYAPFCNMCGDKPNKRCKECSCAVCGKKSDPGKQIICDECDMSYHIWCLEPPLNEIPADDEWYCNECKVDESEIVKAGEKLKVSKKKSKMVSANSNSSRDWGKGMACVGRTTECTLVPPNHFGAIPGIEVGATWKFRVQASEVGVHRPHVAGIHGRESEGAYSIVLSGGYEDDIDNGEEFLYTGSGGRDLSGNKRTAEQSCDQVLTRMNKALAMNCNAPINATKGAEAKDWKGGKPVRVIRNFKLRKHSKYAPEHGNRYDGIYKVVKYYPEKGKSGYQVWRYLLRRDDPAPAPWTEEGKRHIECLGLEMTYPEGYFEALEKRNIEKNPRNNLKRFIESNGEESPVLKKQKIIPFKLGEELLENIADDAANKKRWEELQTYLSLGKKGYLKKVEEEFLCICCQELIYRPITTPCSHNICKVCLERSFEAEVYSCPTCRNDLNKSSKLEVNQHLQNVLISLFPGYEAAR